MAKDVSEVVVGANGSLYAADLESTIPADVTVPFGPEWVEMGYATDAGVKWTVGRTIVDIVAWQSFYPLRKIVTEIQASLMFSLMQWSAATLPFALGGGDISGTEGAWTYTPPDPSVIDERMMGIEWLDGDKIFRLIYNRGIVAEAVEADVTRGAAAVLPITFAALGSEGVDAYVLQTNHPSFAPLAGS